MQNFVEKKSIMLAEIDFFPFGIPLSRYPGIPKKASPSSEKSATATLPSSGGEKIIMKMNHSFRRVWV